jgi:hypothetical protein
MVQSKLEHDALHPFTEPLGAMLTLGFDYSCPVSFVLLASPHKRRHARCLNSTLPPLSPLASSS